MVETNIIYRHRFHLTPKKGWMNDPNGFSFFQDKYHLFYQYNPFTSKWGPMHWGHATTDDFILYEHKDIALKPDTPYDNASGCYSGTAINDNKKHILMYTGVGKSTRRRWYKIQKKHQEQCIAIGDGLTYRKIDENPVIGKSDLPAFAGNIDFRDPKLIKKEDAYYSIIPTKVKNKGSLLLFKSFDSLNSTFLSNEGLNVTPITLIYIDGVLVEAIVGYKNLEDTQQLLEDAL